MCASHSEPLPYETPPGKGDEVQITSFPDGGVRVVIRPSGQRWQKSAVALTPLVLVAAFVMLLFWLANLSNRAPFLICPLIISAFFIGTVAANAHDAACILLWGGQPATMGIGPDRVVVEIALRRTVQVPRRALRTIKLLHNDRKPPKDASGVMFEFNGYPAAQWHARTSDQASKVYDALKLAETNTASSLHIAAGNGNLDLLRSLIDGGADVNRIDERGQTPLHEAAQAGQLDAARMLIERGASVRLADCKGRTPLHLTAGYSRGSWPAKRSSKASRNAVAALLLEHGADPNALTATGDTPLNLAAQEDNPGLVKLLLQSKADCNIANSAGLRPIDYATRARRTREHAQEIIRLLSGQNAPRAR